MARQTRPESIYFEYFAVIISTDNARPPIKYGGILQAWDNILITLKNLFIGVVGSREHISPGQTFKSLCATLNTFLA